MKKQERESNKFAPLVFGSKKFTTGQLSLTMYVKEFLAMHLAFDEFGHIFWGTKKPIKVFTDSKTLTGFFQTKHLPQSVWKFCDQTLQFNLVVAHVPGVENPAAENLSSLEIRIEDRIDLKSADSIPVFQVETEIASKTPKQKEETA